MSLIDTLNKEIKETPEEEVSLKIEMWVSRCRREGVSIHALERLLKLHFHTAIDLPKRSLLSFVSSSAREEQVIPADVVTPPRAEKESFFRKLLGKIGFAK